MKNPQPMKRALCLTISVVLASLVLAACSSSGSGSRAATAPAVPPAATLIARNLTLYPGDTNAIRIGFAPNDPSARVIITFKPEGAPVAACALGSMDSVLPPRTQCERNVRSGVRDIVGRRGMRAIAVVVGGKIATSLDVSIEYDEGERNIALRIPLIPPPVNTPAACADNACNPYFEMTPLRGGDFRATATWSGSDAALVLLQGRVLGRSQTATGIPYRDAARAAGTSPLRIATGLSAPGEYALAFRHDGPPERAQVLRNVVINAHWPR